MPKRIKFHLADQRDGTTIQDAGGSLTVVAAAGTAKVAITDKDGVAATNPVVAVNGEFEFYLPDSVNSCDVYGISPSGHAVELSTVKPGGPNEIYIDKGRRNQILRIPFDIADTTAATETDTGHDLPAKCAVHPWGMGLDVTALDATEDIDVGLLSSESGGDADGFMDAVSTAALGLALATVGFTVGASATYVDLTGGDVEFTYGLFMVGVGTKAAISEGSNADTDEGMYLLVDHLSDEVTAKSVTYTLSTGSDTAAGFINLPYTLLG